MSNHAALGSSCSMLACNLQQACIPADATSLLSVPGHWDRRPHLPLLAGAAAAAAHLRPLGAAAPPPPPAPHQRQLPAAAPPPRGHLGQQPKALLPLLLLHRQGEGRCVGDRSSGGSGGAADEGRWRSAHRRLHSVSGVSSIPMQATGQRQSAQGACPSNSAQAPAACKPTCAPLGSAIRADLSRCAAASGSPSAGRLGAGRASNSPMSVRRAANRNAISPRGQLVCAAAFLTTPPCRRRQAGERQHAGGKESFYTADIQPLCGCHPTNHGWDTRSKGPLTADHCAARLCMPCPTVQSAGSATNMVRAAHTTWRSSQVRSPLERHALPSC